MNRVYWIHLFFLFIHKRSISLLQFQLLSSFCLLNSSARSFDTSEPSHILINTHTHTFSHNLFDVSFTSRVIALLYHFVCVVPMRDGKRFNLPDPPFVLFFFIDKKSFSLSFWHLHHFIFIICPFLPLPLLSIFDFFFQPLRLSSSTCRWYTFSGLCAHLHLSSQQTDLMFGRLSVNDDFLIRKTKSICNLKNER